MDSWERLHTGGFGMPEIDSDEINSTVSFNVVIECLDHLFGLVKSNGKFVYAHRFGDKSNEFHGYNLLRHCGTVWFMCKAIDHLSLDISPERQHLLSTAVQYIVDKLRPPPWQAGSPPGLCLPSRVAVKIGGGGLCLLMLNAYAQLLQNRRIFHAETAASHSLDTLCERLENYLLSEFVDGDFIHKRVFSTGEVLPFRSGYYTGEVLFALIKMGRSPERAAEILAGLIGRDYGVAEQSHWMAYAASEAVQQGLPRKDRTLRYLDRLIGRIIAEPGYRERQQPTPIACRTEAFFAYLETFGDHDSSIAEVRRELRARSYASALENLKLQFAHYGNGQFRRGGDSDKVQIDYIQHNGASFLGLTLLQYPDRKLSAEPTSRNSR